jgi:tRNA threonylcarbamoyl adenosine modification protein YeaZ
MRVLAIEFSTARRSVAVISAKGGTAFAVAEAGKTSAGQGGALALIEQALREGGLEREQIDCIAIGLGPGSYTGIRCAIALAQGWQIARPINLLGISSIECLACQAQRFGIYGRVNIVIDAQRNEFYLAAYEIDKTRYHEVELLHLASRGEVEKRVSDGEIILGPEIKDHFSAGQLLFPEARVLGELALGRTDFIPGEKLEPIYLRETSFVKAPPPRISAS